MYKEKVRVSKLETIIRRMNNKCYESQEELMRAILKVLCANKKETKIYSMSWNSDYNYSNVAFEDADNLLRLVDLKRSIHGTIVDSLTGANSEFDESYWLYTKIN